MRFAGVVREVCLDYQPDAVPGDFVLVHVGFAIAKIDKEEAARMWQALEELGEGLDDIAATDETRAHDEADCHDEAKPRDDVAQGHRR